VPFPEQTSRPFTREGIESIAAGQRGCYGIFKPGTWIYVGKSDDLQRRLLEHLNGDNLCITLHGPTHFVGLVTADPDAREKALILELDPVCNKKVG
jgi:hypothetical protein